MSLLWTQAMAWHNDDREDEDPELHAERDTRPYAVRRPGLVKHIAFVHDVPEHAADDALSIVERGLGRGEHMGSTVDYGFDQHQNVHDGDHPISPLMSVLRNPKAWQHHEVEDVPLQHGPVVATQSWVRHNGVAHNLFHPGLKSPFQDGVEGDPDYDPEWDEDSHAESESEGAPMHEESTHASRWYENEHGHRWCLDGHHRVAADLALGKSHTPGLVARSERDEDGVLRHSWSDPEHFGLGGESDSR